MTLALTRTLVALAACLALSCACTSGSKTGSATGAGAASENPDQVVATYGTGNKVTLKQADEIAASELEDLEKKKFQVRRRAIDRIVIEALVKAEAAKKGIKEEEWVRGEVEAKITDPSEAEIVDFFTKNQGQMPAGSTLETIRPQLINFLKQKKGEEVAGKVFEELRKAHNVQVIFKGARKVVEAKGPARGPESAKVTIVEFSDFQCPYCSRAVGVVDKVMEQYPGKVRLVFRQFPLDFHDKAKKAAEGSLCANEQGKFWEFHDLLFKHQDKLEQTNLKEHATALGLDVVKFTGCLESGKMAQTITEDMEAGRKVGVSGTPAFFVNGQMLTGAQPIEAFKELIDAELR